MTIIHSKTLEDVEIWVPTDLVWEVEQREKFRREALFMAISGDSLRSATARVMARHYQRRIDKAIRRARLDVPKKEL